MNNYNEIQNDMNVINKGKIPENITSQSDTKSVSKTFKVTQAQNEQIKADMEKGGFKNFSEFVLYNIFNKTSMVTIDGGRDLLKKLSECADLLNDVSDNMAHNNSEFAELNKKFVEIELSISQIFDYIDLIKNNFMNVKEDE